MKPVDYEVFAGEFVHGLDGVSDSGVEKSRKSVDLPAPLGPATMMRRPGGRWESEALEIAETYGRHFERGLFRVSGSSFR